MVRIAFTTALILLASQAFSQTFSGGFFLGVAGTQVDGDKFAGFNKGGFTVGATAQVPLAKKFLAAIEIGFTQKGAQSKSLVGSSGAAFPNIYNLRINYVDVPLMLKFYDRQQFGLGIGVQYSRLIGVPKQEVSVYAYPKPNGLYSVGDNDFSGVAEGSYYFAPQWQANLRYSYSWIKMGYSKDSDYAGFGCFNNVIQIRLGYIFGQTFDEKKKKAKPNVEQTVP